MSWDRNLVLKSWIVLSVPARMERKVVMTSCLFFLQFFDVEYANSFIRKVSGGISRAEDCRLFLPLRFLIPWTEIIAIGTVWLYWKLRNIEILKPEALLSIK